MKKLLAILLLVAAFVAMVLPMFGQAIQFTASIPHTAGTPSGAPTGIGAWLRYDKTNKILYRWTGSAWTASLPGAVADGDKGDVTVSGSGTNWQLDASSVGNPEIASGAGGIYKGSGTIPSGVGATVTDEFAITRSGGGDFRVNDTGAHLYATNAGGLVEVAATDDGVIFSRDGTGDFGINSVGILVDDERAIPRGVEYTADYSATYNDRSLVDKGYVTAAVAAAGDGDGIYDGSGTVPSGTVATASRFALRTTTSGYRAALRLDSLVNSTTAVDFYSPGALLLSNGASGNHSYIQFSDSVGHLRVGSVSGDPFYGYFTFQNGTSTYTDGSEEGVGLRYAADYSSTIAVNDRSIPDVGTIREAGFFSSSFVLQDPVGPFDGEFFSGGNLSASRTYSLPDASGTLLVSVAATATLNFPSTAAGTSSDLTITVSGAADGNPVSLGVPNASTLSNTSYSAWVSAANTVTVRYSNHSSSAKDPASGTFRATVLKY